MLFNKFAVRCENVEMAGIDPAASRMQSARSTIWATPPKYQKWDSNPRSITHNILSVTPLTARES